MCVTITINNKDGSKTVCETTEELKAVMPLVIRQGYGVIERETCLCPVDIEETAKQAGFVAKETEYPMEWVFERAVNDKTRSS